MSNWKEKYNYKKTLDDNGAVIGHIIYADGHAEPVSKEFYQSYSQMNDQMLYSDKVERKIAPVSLDSFAMRDIAVDFYVVQPAPSAEEVVLEKERLAERWFLLSKLPQAINLLPDEEQRIIRAVFYEGISLREYARRSGKTLRAIQKRRDRILTKMKKILLKSVDLG